MADILPTSKLFQCQTCGLLYRHPVLTASQYEALYENAPADCSADNAGRMDWALVEGYLARNATAGARVLDFGCNTGGLLKRLGPRYARTGVEVNAGAGEIARAHSGAEIATSLHALPHGATFDFAIIVDVVEHFRDPGRVIASLLEVLRPGGSLIVTTGDADNFLWGLAGARWWYCFYPEHLAFISERWMRGWLQRQGNSARLIEATRFRHLQLTPLRYAMQACFTLLYLAAPRAYVRLGSAARRMLALEPTVYPPGTGLTRDHVFLVLRKES